MSNPRTYNGALRALQQRAPSDDEIVLQLRKMSSDELRGGLKKLPMAMKEAKTSSELRVLEQMERAIKVVLEGRVCTAY